MNEFIKFINPYLGDMLQNLKMDKSFVKGEGCYLYDTEGTRYLDCIAAYGALPFGYNHGEIWKGIYDFHKTMEPSFTQPSALNAAGELAEKILEIAPPGLKYVTFTNSGAETVEAAIKLCRAATGRMGILAAYNSFHGKTLGALSATGKSYYQSAFGAPVNGFNYVEYGDLDYLESEFKKRPDFYAAYIIEPIQGEGGIIEAPKGYMQKVKNICEEHDVLMIVDEIQTGLGRTGSMFACDQESVCPDVLLLAKALGGGIVPIGACICSERVYNKEFAMKHSSTFAGNSLACRIGLKVLEILNRQDGSLIKEAKSKGEYLKRKLEALRHLYPDIIRSVRGRGLMLGLQFGVDTCSFPSSLLGIMAEKDILTPVISSYLLNVEKIRVAPTLNGNDVIRIEPPLVISSEQCDRALEGMENMLKTLDEGNTARFVSFLVGGDSNRKHTVSVRNRREKVEAVKDEKEGRFAFLVHPLDYCSYREFDQSLSVYGDKELAELTRVWNNAAGPFVIARTKVFSPVGTSAFGEFICIMRTAEEYIKLKKQEALEELKAALGMAKENGAGIVGLGAFTSVVSMGGLYLKDEGIPITTGNSYTAVAAASAIKTAAQRLGIYTGEVTAAVVGAAGSIGKGMAALLSESVSRLVLIGNPDAAGAAERLYIVAAEIYKYLAGLLEKDFNMVPESIGQRLRYCRGLPAWNAPTGEFVEFSRKMDREGGPIVISTSAEQVLPITDIVVTATNNIGKIITPWSLKPGSVVCDISRPANVSEEVGRIRPDVLVIDGGVIEVPGMPDLGWDFGFEKGLAYACMAETIMLALENRYEHFSLGSSGVSLESIALIRDLAAKHNFKLANLRSFNKPLGDEKWENVIKSRKKYREFA